MARKILSSLGLGVCALMLLGSGAARADDWTNLRAAICYGPVEEVARVLDSGVNINMRDAQGFTPLMVAAQQGDLDTVKLLLSRGANPLVKNFHGRMAADLANSVEIRDLLAQAGPSSGSGPLG